MAKTNHFGALAAVGLLVLVLVLVEPRPAGATFPGENGKIAYSSGALVWDHQTSEIYTIDPTEPTGGTPFRVTDNCRNDFRPDWSPNARRIAYSAFDPSCFFPPSPSIDYEIYTIAADGSEWSGPLSTSGTKAHPDNSTHDFTPSYDPTGTWIAYSAFDGNDADIFAMDSSGGQFVFGLATSPMLEYDPDWSPDGTKIAFEGFDGNDYEIYTINVDGTGLVKLTDNEWRDGDPSWGGVPF
jgi:Tol biopolymer transport system component